MIEKVHLSKIQIRQSKCYENYDFKNNNSKQVLALMKTRSSIKFKGPKPLLREFPPKK